jgi:hypothetical protein
MALRRQRRLAAEEANLHNSDMTNSCDNAGTKRLGPMLPNPAAQSFTLAIDGRLMSKLSVPSVEAAEGLAVGLAESGRRVEIIDRATGDVVKRFVPHNL